MRPKESNSVILSRVKKEMNRPRITKSARAIDAEEAAKSATGPFLEMKLLRKGQTVDCKLYFSQNGSHP